MHNPCAVIPVYNHETAVPAVVDALLAAGLPCVLVDDASSPACSAVLEQLAQGEGIHRRRKAHGVRAVGPHREGLGLQVPLPDRPSVAHQTDLPGDLGTRGRSVWYAQPPPGRPRTGT